jgi:hypothetical protein
MSLAVKKTAKVDKLYFGTSEKLAKLSPIIGLQPEIIEASAREGPARVGSHRRKDCLYLSAVYPAYFASCNTRPGERWGLVEIDAALLDRSCLAPDPSCLRRRNSCPESHPPKGHAKNGRPHASGDKFRWQDCLRTYGLCIYLGAVPASSITRVAIYDPVSNDFITREVVHNALSAARHESRLEINTNLTRWFMGENMSCQDWMAESFIASSNEDRDRLSAALQERSGLDIYYFGPTAKKVTRAKSASPPFQKKTFVLAK